MPSRERARSAARPAPAPLGAQGCAGSRQSSPSGSESGASTAISTGSHSAARASRSASVRRSARASSVASPLSPQASRAAVLARAGLLVRSRPSTRLEGGGALTAQAGVPVQPAQDGADPDQTQPHLVQELAADQEYERCFQGTLLLFVAQPRCRAGP